MSNSQTRILPLSAFQQRGMFPASYLIAAAWLTMANWGLSSVAHASLQDIESANNQVSAQFQRNAVNYSETANDMAGNEVPLDTESGSIKGWGISGSVMRHLWLGRDYLQAQYSSFSGKTNYTGGTLANPAFGSAVGASGARITNYSMRYGVGFPQSRETMLTLYTEAGRHQYRRTLGLGTASGYQETYWHNYVGIGALMQYSSMDKWVFSVNALIGRTFQSRMDAVLPAPMSGFSTRLGNSSIEKLAFQVDYAFGKHLHASGGVELTAWSYGASANQPVAAGASLYEPNSTTFITTARAGIGYAF